MSTKKIHCLFCFALCAFALHGQEAPPLNDDPAMVQQLSLDIQINTPHSEIAPVLSGDGKTLYFVREGHANNIGEANAADVWVSYLKEDGAWSRAIHLPAPLNNRLPNRILATEVSGDVVYLADRYNNDNLRGLAISLRNGRSWSKPLAMTIEGFVPGDAERPHYQVDVTGNFLLLAANLPGGLGKRDLYVCFRKDVTQWSKPLQLGAALNSSGDEAKTFLAADGRTLYFTSDGRGGYGGLDWFYTVRQDESWTRWSEPKQLGNTINTPDDDQYLTVSHWGEAAIVARGSKDNSELIMVTLPENLRPQPMTLVTGNVVDARTGLALSLPVAHRLYQFEGKEAPLNRKPGSPFALLAPSTQATGGYICPKGYFATSNQFTVFRGELQEEDVDPYGTFAATNLNPLYFQRESEIENLSLRLNQVDIELQEANQLRGIWKQKLDAARQTNPKAWKPEDDPELQALKHRYEEYLSRQRDTIVPPMQVLIAPKQEEKSESVIPASFDHIGQPEDELTELRRRLQNHYQTQFSNQPDEATAPAGKYLWETDPPPFDELSRGIRDSLRQKLYPEVQQQVSREVVAEVLAELARDPNTIPEQEAALREQIRQGLTAATMSHAPLPGAQPTPQKDWERLFAADIEKAVSDEVRTELAEGMRQDVKVALSIEATYLLKKEQSATLRRALGEKVIQQIREEEKKMAEFSEEMPVPQLPQTEPLKIASLPQLQADIALLPIDEGQVILLNQVFFEPNAAKLKAVSYAELDNVVEMLRQNPGMTIEIGAHTHGGISHALAMQLSSQRARVIADYLISKGIPKENVPYRGYGKMIPIAANDTPEGRKTNQRVELNIIKLK